MAAEAHNRLMQLAREAIAEVANDSSVPLGAVRQSLDELAGFIASRIEDVEADAEEDASDYRDKATA
jgi:predicted RNA methylase